MTGGLRLDRRRADAADHGRDRFRDGFLPGRAVHDRRAGGDRAVALRCGCLCAGVDVDDGFGTGGHAERQRADRGQGIQLPNPFQDQNRECGRNAESCNDESDQKKHRGHGKGLIEDFQDLFSQLHS